MFNAVKTKPMFAFYTLMLMLLTGCASSPSFPMLSGQTINESITVHHSTRSSRSAEVSVIVYKPSTLREDKPGVLFFSGCDGRHWQTHHQLARRLNQQGVLVAEVKSIETFGTQCDRPITLNGRERAAHAFLARTMLVERGLVNEDNMGIVGLSHGGWTAIHTSMVDLPLHYNGSRKPFRASVAIYPYCNAFDMAQRPLLASTLVLSGSEDTYTPAEACRQSLNPSAIFHVYQGATHAWDAPNPPRTIFALGRSIFMSYDHRATQDGIERSWQFLVENMRLQ